MTATAPHPDTTPDRRDPLATLTGVGAAIPTLRTPDGAVDRAAHLALGRSLRRQGASMLLVAGTTGGGARCTHTDRVDLLESTDGVTVVGVPEHVTDRELVELQRAGASAVLVHVDPTGGTEAVQRLRDRVADAQLVLVGYHHPSHYAPMPGAWFADLANEHIPVKNSDPDPGVFATMLDAGVHMLVGSTHRLHDVRRGAAGVLSGVAAVRFADVAAAVGGDTDAQARLVAWEQQIAAHRIAAIESAAREMIR